MTAMTITEALAEIKTIGKRLQSKAQFIVPNASRPSVLTDSLAKEGGSEKRVAEEVQAYADLVARIEQIRVAIQSANQKNTLTLEGTTKSVAGWLAWRKECAPHLSGLLEQMANQINQQRAGMAKQSTSERPLSALAHFSEDEIARRRETMEKILGTLDGKLSLFNATCTVDVF